MKAKNLSGQAPGGKRTRLADVLPLRTPFLVEFFPIYACNFKCKYCIFNHPKEERIFISDTISMDFDLYKKCIDDISQFPDKLKVLRFVGMGEPLLHKRIVDMIEYASLKKIAKTIEIITNGSLLTPKMSHALISAGLTRMVVSIQGTSAKKYKEVSQVDIDFDNFVHNLEYYYEYKGDSQLYIKIIDYSLEGKKDEKKFYEIFGDICDTIAVEHIVPIYVGVDYDKLLKGKRRMDKTQFGLPVSEIKVCPQPFFHLQINPDGKVVPCYSFEYPAFMGDVNKESVVDIWNGKKFQDFRLKMLDGVKGIPKVCHRCDLIKYRFFEEDNLNNDVERLKKLYK